MRYKYNRDFFEVIDTPEKAYWLGMFTSDGNIYNNRNKPNKSNAVGIRLRLQNKDANHLVKLNESMESNKNIEIIKNSGYKNGFNNNNSSTISMLNFTSIKLWKDLNDKGLEDNKQTKEKPYMDLSENLIKYYILGLWDGDGTISYSKNGHYSWEFVGSFEMVSWVKTILETKLSINFIKQDTDHRCEKLFRLRTNRKENIAKISKFLYSDKVVYLDRKYETTKKFLNDNGYGSI